MKRRARTSNAGFTLIETLIATAMMVAILAALATVTAQWLPNWNRGFARVAQSDQLALGLERIISDISNARYVPPNGRTKLPLFEGNELSVTFVRTALGPNAGPGLEVVRLAEVNEGSGLAMVRLHSRFAPLPDETPASQLRLGDPVVLLRAPFRVTFAYAGEDKLWRNTWTDNARLPRAVRIAVRDAITQQTLAVSTATLIRVALPAECGQIKVPTEICK
jgi:general secretion pathway protein J